MTSDHRFQYFSEAAPPEGAEGWERMYPYYLIPDEDLADDDNARFWFPDTVHWGRGVYPFDSIGAEAVYLGAGQNSARIYAIPNALGLELRIVNGYPYVSTTPVTDEAKIVERLEHFQQRAGHYYENWDAIYQEWRDKIAVLVANMDKLSFEKLPEYEPVESVLEHRGRSGSWQIVENYHTLVDQFFLLWQHHFEMINLGYGGFLTFFQFCKGAFPTITDQTVAQMVSGIDIVAFRPDEELRRLAQQAVDLGVDGVITDSDSAQGAITALATTDDGRTWLTEYDQSSNPWFVYFSEYGFTHLEETWIDKPDLAYRGITRYIERLRKGENLTRPVDKIQADRDRIVDGYRSLLSGEQLLQFDGLLELARKVYPHIEEHNIYVEHWGHAVFWRKVRELAEFLVGEGFFADPEDLYYLNRFELDQVIFDVVDAWAKGVQPRGVAHWAREVAQRRDIVNALVAASPAPAYGTPPQEVTDPLAVMNYGVTTPLVKEWLAGATTGAPSFTGIAASPGVAEGVVRVLKSESELDSFQPGEILVAPITAPSWGPVFSSAAAVVTDSGGMMSHAAIVCREYNLPAVVGCGYATTKLTTGQRIRVDGNTGQIELLEEMAN